jgi:hypothetical protein
MELLQPKLVVVGGNDAKAQRALRELRTRVTNIVTTIDERAITITARRGKVFLETMSGKRLEIP